jgi:hypothetical protein
VHEIKHDGYRLMARRDPVSVGIRLLTGNGHDWASRYPLIVQAVTTCGSPLSRRAPKDWIKAGSHAVAVHPGRDSA